jgi:glyoxylase-like metal-dependent hydrolase (beta-lactamase superfamily II)
MKKFKIENFCVDVFGLVMGPIDNNVYLLTDGVGRIIVDPSCDAPRIVSELLPDGATLDAIVLTHAHWDHTGAAAKLRQLTGAPVYASAVDAPHIENPNPGHTGRVSEACTVDVRVSDGSVIEAGNMRWKVLETPGHTKGSICLLCDGCVGEGRGVNSCVSAVPEAKPSGAAEIEAGVQGYRGHVTGARAGAAPVLVSGDTLFNGTTGRTDFFGGSDFDMARSMKKLSQLDPATLVLPGHNDPTTIQASRPVFTAWGC